MPYEVQWRGKNIYTRIFGQVTLDDFFSYSYEIRRDSRYELRSFEIIDFLGVTGIIFDEKDIDIPSTLDKYVARWDSNPKIAYVTDDPEIERFCNMYIEMMNDTSWDIRIFHSLKEAEKWCTSKE